MATQHTLFLLFCLAFMRSFGAPSDTLNNDSVFVDPRDGNEYEIINIDGTFWFVDDLRFDTKSQLYKLPHPSTNGNFYSHIEAQNVCPKGWRLPSIKDWGKFLNYVEQKDGIKHSRFSVHESRKRLQYNTRQMYFFSDQNPLKLTRDGRVDHGKLVRFGLVDYWVSHEKTDFTHSHITSRNVTIHSHTKEIIEDNHPVRLFKVKCVCQLKSVK